MSERRYTETPVRTHRVEPDYAYPLGDDRDERLFRRDLIRWGPVFAGLAVTLMTIVLLSAFGIGVGWSGLAPDEQGLTNIGAGEIAWSVFTYVFAFFVGGFTAAMTSAVGGWERAAFNGWMVGVLAVVATIILVAIGAGNILGATGTNLGDITEVGLGGGDAGMTQDQFEAAEAAAWGTFVAILIALGSGALGGVLGTRKRAAGEPEREERFDNPVR